MLILVTLFQAAVMCSWPTLALYVEQLGVERTAVATTTGVVVFAAGLPSMLLATTWSRWGRRVGPLPALAASLFLNGAANLAMAAAAGLPTVLALRACAGAGAAGFVPLTFEWMHARAPEGARGRMAGLGSMAMMVGNVIGPLFGGWLAVHVGLAATFWVPGALLAVVGALLCATGNRHGSQGHGLWAGRPTPTEG
jgi:DHA1 family multidrug resistance protein-like MFS transporter